MGPPVSELGLAVFNVWTLEWMAGRDPRACKSAPTLERTMSKGQLKNWPYVVIVIVATDEAGNIVGCLECLTASNYRNFGIIICENGGPEAFDRNIGAITETIDLTDAPNDQAFSAKCFFFGSDNRSLTLLKSRENRGYSGGVNACIAAAGNDWDFIWVLNPDTFPEPEALEALVRRQAEGGFGMVGSRLVYASNGRVQVWGGHKFSALLGRCRSLGMDQSFAAKPDFQLLETQLDTIAGASMFVSREYIQSRGVMDEDFFVYYEDIEWSLRRGQFRLGYAHDFVVRHIAGATSGSGGTRSSRSRFSIYLEERNRILIAKKRLGRIWPLPALLGLLQTLEHLVRFRSLRSFRIAVSGWWAGVRGETGMPGFMRNEQTRSTKAYLKRAN